MRTENRTTGFRVVLFSMSFSHHSPVTQISRYDIKYLENDTR